VNAGTCMSRQPAGVTFEIRTGRAGAGGVGVGEADGDGWADAAVGIGRQPKTLRTASTTKMRQI
jgi:hypothetical protein